jgi:outer membrane protein assembly complex protein YaeT
LGLSLAWAQSTLSSAQTTSEQTGIANALGGIAKYQGRTVDAIEFRGISGSNPEMLQKLMGQRPGEPLDRDKLHASLQALYATGRFATLQVEAEADQNNGLKLIFVATENYFNGAVNADGAPKKTGPRPHELVNATKLDLGDVFAEDKVKRSVDRMLKVMQDNGYYESTITYDLLPHDETRQMDVTFHVVPNVLARVGTVTLQGDTGIPPDKIQKITKLKPGDKVKPEHLTRALERLRKNYQKNGHLEAQVSLIERQYQPDSDRLNYIFKVDEGSRVAILTEGQKVRQGQLKKLIPVYQENAVDDDLLNEGRRNLRDYLQTKGYFNATVEVERREDRAQGLVNIVYKIDAGTRHKLAAIKIEGNKYFDTATIRERMNLEPSSLITANGRFNQRMLANDITSIKMLYQANGFQEVKVEAEVKEDYNGRKGDLAVLIKVDEGPQTLVNSLKLVGNSAFSDEELTSLMSTLPGQPFSDANVAGDRDAVTYFYYNRGFPDFDFEAAAHPVAGDPQRMDVTYTMKEGLRVFVDRVLVSGLNYTRPYVVDRRMRIRSGDPLSQSRMVDSQRRLYDLGIFNQVDMAVQNPDGEEPEKNVLFNLHEALRWTFRYGGGVEVATGNIPTSNPQGSTGVSPNGVVEVTRLNMFGKDQTLTMRARAGLLTRRALISYDAPRLFRRENWRITATAFYDNTADVNTFTSSRLEGTIQADQRYSRITRFLYRMSYSRVQVDPNSLVIDPNLIPLYTKPVRIGMPSFTWIRDKRDNPIDSHTGNYSIADLGVASTVFGSEADFARILLQNSSYYTIHKHWVLARNTQLGAEYPFGITSSYTGEGAIPPPPGTSVIPLPDLFFSGGSNSLRGFAINQAGPRDPQTGYAVGGQGLFVNNLELRTPPVLLPYVGDNLGFVFFHDMGNVFNTAQQIGPGLIRIHQPSITACSTPGSKVPCNYSYNNQAVGIGLRYKTPVGPVRGDISYTFNPTRYPIQQQDKVEALRRINFFFSIGQTF